MDILQFKEKINPSYRFYFKEQPEKGKTNFLEDIITFATRYDVQILKATPYNKRNRNEVHFFVAPKAGTLFFYEKDNPLQVIKASPVKRAMTVLANIDGKILAIPRERFMDEYHIDFNSGFENTKATKPSKPDIEKIEIAQNCSDKTLSR